MSYKAVAKWTIEIDFHVYKVCLKLRKAIETINWRIKILSCLNGLKRGFNVNNYNY